MVTIATGAILTGMGVGLNAVSAEVFRVKPQAALPGPAKHAGDVGVEKETLKGAIHHVASYLEDAARR